VKSDELIQRDVETELRWCPEVDATDIAVKVTDGVVSLTGYARNFHEKFQAEAASRRVVGVTAVADDIEVRQPACTGLTDPEVARAVVEALRAGCPQIAHAIEPIVVDRHVTLEGQVDWNHQREQAETMARKVRGVREVINRIRVIRNLESSGIRQEIEQAFRRRADLDASHVSVEASGTEVKLTGEVASLAEHDAAVEMARATHGVRKVTDQLVVKR